MDPVNENSSGSDGAATDSRPDAGQNESIVPDPPSNEGNGGTGAPPPLPPPAPPSSTGDHSERLQRIESLLADLDRKFERRLQTDTHKNALFDQLHAELQEHKSGLIQKIIQPMLVDLIRLHDDVSALVSQFAGEEEPAVQRALRPFTFLPDDIADILERNQTEIFNEPVGAPFDPARQKVMKKIPSSDPAADKTIAESVRPGFIWNGRIIRHQSVHVHTYSPADSSASTPAGTSTI